MNLNANKDPRFVGTMRALNNNRSSNFTTKQHGREFDRTLLPAPPSYYCKQFPDMKIKSGSVKVRCCFHQPDKNPSLLISMIDGHFKCLSCGTKGRDVIAFHMQRYGITFPQAVTYFGAWNYE
ncbi:MAG: CHC2 zinc finger domain-containing protein [Coxiellaceae bacterium]|nr:CHC2 zinc finger domain-containing protein [Coxiellaceae bacterium]